MLVRATVLEVVIVMIHSNTNNILPSTVVLVVNNANYNCVW